MLGHAALYFAAMTIVCVHVKNKCFVRKVVSVETQNSVLPGCQLGLSSQSYV